MGFGRIVKHKLCGLRKDKDKEKGYFFILLFLDEKKQKSSD
jgi:hypothetical protein